MTGMDWPDHFPPDCPPKGTKPASGTVYRLVQNDPVKAYDLMSQYERARENKRVGKTQTMFKPKPGPLDPLEVGVSVCRELKDAEVTKEIIPGMDKRSIAKGTLDPTLGVIKSTPAKRRDSHHTWWVPDGARPERLTWEIIP